MMNSVASPSLRTASVVRGPTTSPSVASSRSLPRNKKSPSEPRRHDVETTVGTSFCPPQLGGDRVFNQLPSPQQLEQSPINQEPRCVIPNHTLLLDASGTTPAELSLPALQAVAPAHAADAVLDGPPAQTEVCPLESSYFGVIEQIVTSPSALSSDYTSQSVVVAAATATATETEVVEVAVATAVAEEPEVVATRARVAAAAAARTAAATTSVTASTRAPVAETLVTLSTAAAPRSPSSCNAFEIEEVVGVQSNTSETASAAETTLACDSTSASMHQCQLSSSVASHQLDAAAPPWTPPSHQTRECAAPATASAAAAAAAMSISTTESTATATNSPSVTTTSNSSSDTTLSSVACAPPTSPLASPPTEAAAEVTSSSNGLVLATPPKPTPVSADATTGSVLSARRTSPSKQNSVVVFNPPKPTPVSADATSGSVLSARRSSPSKHNSVVIKSDSMVKDAAGAIAKVLDRILHMFVAAIKLDLSHESLNRAVKAMAVARKYIKDSDPTKDLTFLPLNRSNCDGHEDPNLFGFLVFKTSVSEGLLEGSETDINVSRVSDPVSVANAIIQHSLERGQMIMKAGGASAMHVAMTAVITARRHLKFNYGVDVMLVPAWVTSDTVSKLGRESKFLQFNVIRCEPNGPVNDATIHPSKGSYEGPAGPAFA